MAAPLAPWSFGGEGKGAAGWLIGEENRGLSYMFTMMNSARLHVGLEGVGLSELATQKAVAFAAERVQGRPLGRREGAIIQHPDVRRMIMFMKSMTEAARAISYAAAGAPGPLADRRTPARPAPKAPEPEPDTNS